MTPVSFQSWHVAWFVWFVSDKGDFVGRDNGPIALFVGTSKA